MQSLPALSRDKDRERALQTRLVLSHEQALERRLAAVIHSVGQHVARMYRDHGSAGIDQAMQAAGTQIGAVLKPALVATAREFGHRLLQAPKSAPFMEAKAFEDLDANIANVIGTHTAARITQIDYSLRQTITEIIRRGMAEGWSETQIAEAIQEATGGEMAEGRARRIARTEIHTAANMGQFAAAEASPLVYMKEWLSTEDQRTRAAHAAANGQTVDLLEPFVVGGEELMMPGDPNASPGNTINCRCTMLLTPVLGPMGTADEAPRPTAEVVVDLQGRADLFATAQDLGVTPEAVTLYTSGPELGLPEFASRDDIAGDIGADLGPLSFTGWLDPRMVNGGLQDTFPLFGRPVVVEVYVPEGVSVNNLAPGSSEMTCLDVTVRLTNVVHEKWGDVQDEAGVEIDRPQRRRRYRRLPPKRGVTLVTAKVLP